MTEGMPADLKVVQFEEKGLGDSAPSEAGSEDEYSKPMSSEEAQLGKFGLSETHKMTLVELNRKKPRTYCAEIAPTVLEYVSLEKARHRDAKMALYERMMRKAKIGAVTEKMKHLSDLDRSEAIIPHGEVSKKLYHDIFGQRVYDLYGRRMQTELLGAQKELDMKKAARDLGIDYVTEDEQKERERQVKETKPVDLYDRNLSNDVVPPELVTAHHNIGMRPKYNAPPGFTSDPVLLANSYGHENYYSYDGDWKWGKLHGMGKYLFSDEGTYYGEWEANRQCGEGRAQYPNGSFYQGEWRGGKYHGRGVLSYRDARGVYTGEMSEGRAHGTGRFEYFCGLVYEGAFLDGQPHGRGVMTSKRTAYSYDGDFRFGSICGSGSLITPPPKSERIIRYWPMPEEPMLLPGAVRWYLEYKEDQALEEIVNGECELFLFYFFYQSQTLGHLPAPHLPYSPPPRYIYQGVL
jgi:hypothetical protein